MSAPERPAAPRARPAGLRAEDRRDHLVGRAVAGAAEARTAGRSRRGTAAATRAAMRPAPGPRRGHRDEGPEGDGGAAEPVGEPPAGGPDEGAEQRAEERQVRRLDRGVEVGDELHLQDLAEGEAEPDERAERADVQHRHDPGVRVPAGVAHGAPVVADLRQVVHVQRRGQGGQDDERDVDAGDEARGGRAGGGEHQQPDELDDGDAEVAAAGVDAERPALEPLRVERVDVGHRGGEVAAADAGARPTRTAAW